MSALKDKSTKITMDEHKQNIDYIFNEIGFGFFVLKNFLWFFWWLDFGILPVKIMTYFYSNHSIWLSYDYDLKTYSWLMFNQVPTLNYIGWFCIALALSNPKTIQQILYRLPLLKTKISRDLLNTQTLIYGFFVGFLASHLSSVLMDLPDIFASSAINYIRIF